MVHGPRAQRFPRRLSAVAAAAALAVSGVSAAQVAAHPRARVKAPASGKYKGHDGGRRQLNIWVTGRSIEVVEIQFKCGRVTGTTGLDEIPVHKSKSRYRFAINADGGVTYSDGLRPDNASISIKGLFATSGKAVGGTVSVKSPRCGRSGRIHWSAKR